MPLAVMHVALTLIYSGLAIWAVLAYRRVPNRKERLRFLSIVGVACLVFATVIFSWARPDDAAVLRHPIRTVLGYLFAALVLVGFVVDQRSRRERNGSHVSKRWNESANHQTDKRLVCPVCRGETMSILISEDGDPTVVCATCKVLVAYMSELVKVSLRARAAETETISLKAT
jgi:hypothetical protein